MAPTLFLSYARADLGEGDGKDGLLDRFFRDLQHEVAMRAGIPLDQVAFLDRSQPAGTRWADAIAHALSECKVYVPLYSPHFFKSTNCGREWEAIRRRAAAHESATGRAAQLVLPVWWIPDRGDLPASVRGIQHTKDQFGDDYRNFGLRFLLQQKTNRDQYLAFLVKFADMVITAAAWPANPYQVADFLDLPSAFVDVGPGVVAAPPAPAPGVGMRIAGSADRVANSLDATTGGPSRVTFVVATGGQDEMRKVRPHLDVYGLDWSEWRPFHPACSDSVTARAQGVASQLNLVSSPGAVDDSLTEVVEVATRSNKLVALLVDPWAVQLPTYAKLLSSFDGIRSAHAFVVVPWESTESVGVHRDALRDGVQAVLGNWADAGENSFRDGIETVEQFTDALQTMLIAGRARIVARAEVARRVAETGPIVCPEIGGPI